MAEVAILRLSQERETPTQTIERPRFVYRYAYARSADSRTGDEPGQDYLVVQENGAQLAFALCDGVSQSFMGHIGARLLGEMLVDWLWNALPPGDKQNEIADLLEFRLKQLTAQVTAQVHDTVLPPNLPQMLIEVLERKRQNGSESTFVAGLLDTVAGRMVLVWMGDSRIRLWNDAGEQTSTLGDSFQTRERWSSRRGPVGRVHAYCSPLGEFRALAAYSDGLALLDRQATRPPADHALNGLIADANAAPTSDDISFLEVSGWPITELQFLPVPLDVRVTRTSEQVRATWAAVPGASAYEVQLDGSRATFWQVEGSVWALPAPDLPIDAQSLRVRALRADQSSRWSEPVGLPPAPPNLPAPLDVRVTRVGGQVRATWAAVPGASAYEVLLDGSRATSWQVEGSAWAMAASDLPIDTQSLRVRALRADQSSRWSEPVGLPALQAPPQLYMLIGLGALAIIVCLCVLGAALAVPWRQISRMIFGRPTNTAVATATMVLTPTERIGPPFTPIPSASSTKTPTITPTAVLTPTALASITPTITPTAVLTPTALASITPTITPTAVLTPTALASITPTPPAVDQLQATPPAAATPTAFLPTRVQKQGVPVILPTKLPERTQVHQMKHWPTKANGTMMAIDGDRWIRTRAALQGCI